MKAISAVRSNSKYFFNYAKNIKVKTQIGSLLNEDGTYTITDYDMAEKLRRQYEKSFSAPLQEMKIIDPVEFFMAGENENTESLQNIDFNICEVEDALSELNSSAAAGPEGMPAILLKQCKKELAVPLYMIWRISLNKGKVPKSMKYGLISPIHKGGSRGDATQYRPITLTSFIVKVFEKVIQNRLIDF